MASQGPLSPGTVVSDSALGSIAWGSPGNAAASDDARATATLGGSDTSEWLKATMGANPFSIPTGATIDGIVVEVERKASVGTAQPQDLAVRIVKGGAIGATDKSSGELWTAGEAYFTYGSSTELWGETWTDTDTNASTFGFALRVQEGDFSGFDGAQVDHIRITVYYTETAPGPPVNTTPPAISGTTEVGQILSCTTGDWTQSPTSYDYQWQRANEVGFTTGVTNIGTDSATYLLTASELDKYIRCQVTAFNAEGNATEDSNIVGPVTPAYAVPLGMFDADMDIRNWF